MIKHKDYRVEQVGAEHWHEFKAIRLEALQNEPLSFNCAYEKDAALSDDDWIRGLSYEMRGSFLLFHHNDIIGLTVILRDKDKPEKANLFASYIRKEHRGQKLSEMLYEARIQWAWANGVTEMTTDHRKDNAASGAAMRKYGFKETHAEIQKWHDGTDQEIVYYKLTL